MFAITRSHNALPQAAFRTARSEFDSSVDASCSFRFALILESISASTSVDAKAFWQNRSCQTLYSESNPVWTRPNFLGWVQNNTNPKPSWSVVVGGHLYLLCTEPESDKRVPSTRLDSISVFSNSSSTV